ncbi:MAG: DEAD/DEAH box helicase [Bdellovibrionota bacterium]
MDFQLRPFQREALRALSAPAHLLCVAPTGSGKSLIFERHLLDRGGKMLLISPLVALARQQKERLLEAGLTESGASGFRILCPESLQFESVAGQLRKWKPDFLVVDECHCFWEWGERFRPSYRLLPGLLKTLPISRSLWMTATLHPDARAQLRAALPSPLSELGGFDLPQSLQIRVIRVSWAHRASALLRWLELHPEPGILFVPTREMTERLSRLIEGYGREVLTYHAGMGKEERLALETKVRQGASCVVVATSAFGMGMDYSHLRWAALWCAPLSLSALAQAIGRVGRGDSADAVVFWDEEDFRLCEWSVRGSEVRQRELLAVAKFLESRRCRRAGLKEYFDGEAQVAGCGRCDQCLR